MRSQRILAAVASLFVIGTTLAFAADKPTLEGIKCVMQPTKAIDESKSVEWKKGKVYFCCANCPKAFTADKEKHAAKKLDESTAIEVGGAKVAFCCTKCQGKVKDAKGAEQLDLVFSEKAFEKGKFELVKEEK
jgi:hypothetical protein